jgi:hypothetical protein
MGWLVFSPDHKPMTTKHVYTHVLVIVLARNLDTASAHQLVPVCAVTIVNVVVAIDVVLALPIGRWTMIV